VQQHAVGEHLQMMNTPGSLLCCQNRVRLVLNMQGLLQGSCFMPDCCLGRWRLCSRSRSMKSPTFLLPLMSAL
jgi:hypothetical protein